MLLLRKGLKILYVIPLRLTRFDVIKMFPKGKTATQNIAGTYYDIIPYFIGAPSIYRAY